MYLTAKATPAFADMACQTMHYSIFLFDLLHCYCIFLYLIPIAIHCYCIFFIFEFNLCSFLLYIFRFYSIFDHLYLIINDLYAIVFHYYSISSIYIPNFSFVFYIIIFLLYNSDLYSILSYLYLIFVHFYSIFLMYILFFHVSII